MLSEKQEENTQFKPSEVSSAAASFTGQRQCMRQVLAQALYLVDADTNAVSQRVYRCCSFKYTV